MQRFTRYLMYRPWVAILLLVGLTIMSLVGVMHVTIDAANERLFIRHSESYRVYQRFLTAFGRDEAILVALYDPEQSLLRPAGIAAIRRLTKALAELPQVAAIFSLMTAPDMARLMPDPFATEVPRLIQGDTLTQAQIAALRDNPYLVGTLLSPDLHTAGFLVTPEQTIAQPAVRTQWIADVRAVAARHAVQGRQTYVAGTPLEQHDVARYIEHDQRLIVPLVLVVLLTTTWCIYRSKRLALIPFVAVLLSLAWTMGTLGFIGIPLNIVTSLLSPVIMVVSVSVSIHLMNQFLDEIEAGSRGVEAVENAVEHVGAACLLTSLTTALGFFSLMASPVPAVRDFALCAGLGVLMSFVATLIWVPIALHHIWATTAERLVQLKTGTIERLLDRLVLWLAGHREKIVWGSVLALIVTLPGMWHLTEGTDIVRALRQHAPLRVSTEFIDQHLTGVNALEFVVQMPNVASLDVPETIRHLLRFSAWLRTQPGVTAVNSAWEPLRGIRPDFLHQDDALSTLATLLRGAFPMMHAWLNTDQKLLRVSARVNAMRSDRLLALARRVEEHAQQEAFSLQTTGSAYLLARMSRTLVHTQLRTLGLAALLVLGSITLALRSWQLGCLAAIPNVLPILLMFGLMGWWGIDLSTATTMIASVALGLIVDDTIHLLYRYGRERRAGLAPLPAIEQSLRHTGRAIISTTVILTLGFWSGVLGSFRPTIEFSFLTGLTLLLALLSDLLVTPTAILAWEQSPGCR